MEFRMAEEVRVHGVLKAIDFNSKENEEKVFSERIEENSYFSR
jgi:hypothetical protein